MKPSAHSRHLINGLQVKCVRAQFGCEFRDALSRIAIHESDCCEYRPVSCPDCAVSLPHRELTHHRSTHPGHPHLPVPVPAAADSPQLDVAKEAPKDANMKLRVLTKSLAGDVVSVECSPHDSLLQLKHMLCAEAASQHGLNWPAHMQQLFRCQNIARDDDHDDSVHRADEMHDLSCFDDQTLLSLNIRDGELLAVLIEDAVYLVLLTGFIFSIFIFSSFFSTSIFSRSVMLLYVFVFILQEGVPSSCLQLQRASLRSKRLKRVASSEFIAPAGLNRYAVGDSPLPAQRRSYWAAVIKWISGDIAVGVIADPGLQYGKTNIHHPTFCGLMVYYYEQACVYKNSDSSAKMEMVSMRDDVLLFRFDPARRRLTIMNSRSRQATEIDEVARGDPDKPLYITLNMDAYSHRAPRECQLQLRQMTMDERAMLPP
jgi:hypothetical protein